MATQALRQHPWRADPSSGCPKSPEKPRPTSLGCPCSHPPAVAAGRGALTDPSSPGSSLPWGCACPSSCSAAIGAAVASWLPDPACTLVPLPAAPLPTLQAAELAVGLRGSCCNPGEARRIRVSRLVSLVATLERTRFIGELIQPLPRPSGIKGG